MSHLFTLPTNAYDLTVADNTTTGDVKIAPISTSGTVEIATNSSRTASTTIGNSSASGDVLIKGVSMSTTTSTYTPVIGGTGGSDFTMSTQTGTIVKFGPYHYFTLLIVYTDKGTASGNIRIKGLGGSAGADTGNPLMTIGVDTWTGRTALQTISANTMPGSTWLEVKIDNSSLGVAAVASTGTVVISGFLPVL